MENRVRLLTSAFESISKLPSFSLEDRRFLFCLHNLINASTFSAHSVPTHNFVNAEGHADNCNDEDEK